VLRRRCGFEMPGARPCGAPPGRDSKFCFWHDPDKADDLAVGQLIGAPVPAVSVVDVDPAVASTIKFSNGKTAHGGLSHGSRWLVPDVRQAIDHARVRRTQGNSARYCVPGLTR
jgi:hypothetical protein